MNRESAPQLKTFIAILAERQGVVLVSCCGAELTG